MVLVLKIKGAENHHNREFPLSADRPLLAKMPYFINQSVLENKEIAARDADKGGAANAGVT